jgi:hypothetical protein
MADRYTEQPKILIVAAPGVAVAPGEYPRCERREPLRTAAGGVDAEWLWLLDGTAAPRPDTLERLLDASAVADVPAPALLASAVLGEAGVPVAGHAPWHRRGGTDVAMRSARHGLLPIRAARGGSLLVRADAARAAGPPRGEGPAAALEWTARILRAAQGYLVTASRADAVTSATWAHAAVGTNAGEDARFVLAMLAGDAFAPKERLWIAGEAFGRLRPRGAA